MDAAHRAVTVADVMREALPLGSSPQVRRAWVEDAAGVFQRYGLVAIRNAVPKAAVAAVLADFRKRHDVHMAPGQAKLYRRFQTDPLRAQVPVAIDGPVANPEFFAPPSVMAVVDELMGRDLLIGEMGAVITHPGAGAQEPHRDSLFLFGGTEIDAAMPPFAMNMLAPLIDIEPDEGATEYWPGSHRICDEAAAMAVPPIRLALEAGSVALHDMRVLHRGGAKPSGPVRPLVYISHHRNWHYETNGYSHKPHLLVTPTMLERLPPAYRPLFSWALHLNGTTSLDEFAYRWIGRLRRRLLKLKR